MTDQPDPPLARCACGGAAKYLNYSGCIPSRHDVACSDCSANTPVYDTRSEAIAAWNRMQDADDRIEKAVGYLTMVPDLTIDDYSNAQVKRLVLAMQTAWAALTEGRYPESARRAAHGGDNG